LIWNIPIYGLSEIEVRAHAAKVVIKQGDSSGTLKVSILGGKEGLWRHEVQSILVSGGISNTSASGSASSGSNLNSNESLSKVLKITGPEEGISIEDTILSIELPPGAPSSKFAFEEVRAELQGVSKLTLSALKGKITGKNTGEGIKYFMQKGDIQSTKHTGTLEIESFGGKISISESQGATKIKLFSGDLVLEKNTGALSIESYSSSAKISDHQGNVNLQWGKGNLVINEFAGRLEGTSADGQLQIQLKTDSLIDLNAIRGKVSVKLPASSGASLNLKSVSGELILPGTLKPTREGRFRVVHSKLPGTQKGSVAIHSDEASIVIR